MKTLLRFLPWLVLAAAVCLRAQLPPPTAAGTVNIEVSVGGDARFVQHDYQPPKPYTILAETLTRSVAAASTPILVPGKAGSVTSVFAFDENYSSSHPEIQKPIRGTGPNFESGAYYRSASVRTDWDEQGRPTFSLRGLTGRAGSLLAIEGRGEGRIFQNERGPSAYPSPRYRVEDVIRTEGKVPWFSLGRRVLGGSSYPLDYRYLTGAGSFWTETQPDGTIAVFHAAFYRPLGNELGEFYPIGAVTTSGTPGEPPHFETQTESLTPDAALQKLKAADWSFTGEFVATSPATAVYVSDSNGATASKLRYKLQVQPGLARTIIWSETFTPEGAGGPSEYRFISEDVSATASETPIHTLDPFQWLEGRPGRYEVVAFESESFDATLTADTNRDGALVSAGGPITPYVIAHADTVSTEQPFLLAVNADDDDVDGALDRVDAVVNGANDLADFVPVFLNIKQLLAMLPPSANARYKLKQADGALNFVYTDLMQATAFNYLNNPGGGFGPAFDQPAAVAPVEAITPVGVELSADFLNRIKMQGQGVILIEATRPTQQPLVLSVETATGTAIVRLPLLAYEASIAVDANRDGEIKVDGSDVTSAERPFGFWLNDDNDELVDSSTALYTEWELDDRDVAVTNRVDWTSNTMKNTRDLEDFTRLTIKAAGLTQAISNQDIRVGFKWTDVIDGTPAIKVFRATEENGGLKYLTDTTIANQQAGSPGHYAVSDIRYSGNEHTLIDTSGSFVLPAYVFNNFAGNPTDTAHLLFEGCRAGKGQLKLILTNRAGVEIGESAGVWLELKAPKEFIERWSAGDGDLSAVQPVVRVNSKSVSPAWDNPVADEEKDYVLYVHGYNMQEFEKQRWLETTYKRLWHIGYKGRVGGFTWPCSQSAPPYDQSEEKAWQSATPLMALLSSLKTAGYRVHVLGHSQGNVVIGEALRQWKAAGNTDALVRTYVASQGAIPAHCYDPNAALIPGFAGSLSDDGTTNVYANYPPTGAPYMSAAAMSGVATRFRNFENPDDYALTGNSAGKPTWQLNQRLKPDIGYTFDSVSGTFWSGSQLTFPGDRFRIFSYAAEGRSFALGSTVTEGVFWGGDYNLKNQLGYSLDHIWHSGQFRCSMAERHQYWRALMQAADLTPNLP